MFSYICFVVVFFFFKQKTAYEMRISDWSSDVCSSDLLPGTFRDKLNENSTSWMLGVNYKATPTLLLYANVSKGYKAGSFPGVSAGTFAQYAAVTQESLVDYEAGFNTKLLDRKVTLHGRIFYYAYKNKQLRAKFVDPFFKSLDGLVNVPKSRVKGAELELSARVVEGLTVSAAATYIDAKVRHYQGIVGSVANEVGLFDPIRGDFSGARLPFSPKWQSSLSADYRSEEHPSELQSLMRISYAVFCLKKKTKSTKTKN